MSIESVRKFYQDLRDNPSLRKDLDAAGSPAARQEYVKGKGYDFTRQEFEAVTAEILAAGKTGKFSDKDLESIAGGAYNTPAMYPSINDGPPFAGGNEPTN